MKRWPTVPKARPQVKAHSDYATNLLRPVMEGCVLKEFPVFVATFDSPLQMALSKRALKACSD